MKSEIEDFLKFLETQISERVSWKKRLRYVESKVGECIGLFYKDKSLLLDRASSLAVYYSYIHYYVSYGNLAWASTNRANLRKTLNRAIRIIFNKNGFEHTNGIFLSANILNIC